MPAYSKEQIEEMVRVERLELRQELIPLERRVRWIRSRLAILDNSDGLIEGLDRKLVV
jgi:hypothetical protein